MRTLVPALFLLCACGPVESDGVCDFSTELWRDLDGDGFGGGAPQTLCFGTPGWVTNDLDCAPEDPRAFPGQVEWQNVPVNGLSTTGLAWDFDCDGQVVKRWLPSAQCYTTDPTPTGSCYQGISSLPTPDGYWRETQTTGGVPECGVMRPWIYRCGGAPYDCLAFSENRVQACR